MEISPRWLTRLSLGLAIDGTWGFQPQTISCGASCSIRPYVMDRDNMRQQRERRKLTWLIYTALVTLHWSSDCSSS